MKAFFLLTSLAFATSIYAVTFCVSVSDGCCDANPSTTDYTIPAGQHIDTTYVWYNVPSGAYLNIECWDIADDEENFQFWVRENLTGCGTIWVRDNHAIGQNHHLRFKATCAATSFPCPGTPSVAYIYSPASNAACHPNCEKD
jgi:hypothetical protein